MERIYWVGPRQSDINNAGIKFAGSITIYGDNTNGNVAYCQNSNIRINHNIINSDLVHFIATNVKEICNKYPHSQFLFYNPISAYQYDDTVLKHVIGLNSYELLDMLSDKIRCKMNLAGIVETTPYITLNGSKCSFSTIRKYFPDSKEYVLQKKYSSGGEGTFLIRGDNDISASINNNDEYLISPYYRESIPINIHIAILGNQIVTFPPSIQIITNRQNHILYQGADFICYDLLSHELKTKVRNISLKIGNYCKQQGFKGILGIDYLYHDKQLYFMEINPRFQASSHLLNKGLQESNQNSLFSIQLQAFGLMPLCKIKSFKVPYSNYTFTSSNISTIRLQKVLKSVKSENIQMDGYSFQKNVTYEENAYLCRCIFDENICAPNRNSIVLHPNFYTEDSFQKLFWQYKNQKEYIKFALLNHGVTFSDEALIFAKEQGTIRDAVFDAIDIVIFDNISVNVPYKCKFVSFSPFEIKVHDRKFILFWDANKICDIEISFMPTSLLNRTTKSGIPYDAIINLANDRIRINPAPICVYKKEGKACKFCNLPLENAVYDINDIIETIDYCLEKVEFRHFLIGGGTYSLAGGWDIILKIATYIRSRSNKDIYLMSIPPQDISILDKLKKAGITEVAFNLEVFDRELAKLIMPGKGYIELNTYIEAFKHAVQLWGKTGCVRSLLIYGFDTNDIFLEGIEKLCQLGVEPIISIFRPLANTEYFVLNPPTTLDIFKTYQKCIEIVKRYNLSLGPDCPQCQNNTLSYTDM